MMVGLERLKRCALSVLLVLGWWAGATRATTEEMKRWILANKDLLPRDLRDHITTASGAEITAALLRLLGFRQIYSKTPLAAILPPEMTAKLPDMVGTERGKLSAILRPVTDRADLLGVAKEKSALSVCPFDAAPLVVLGEYSYCKPANTLDCPYGYICDQSFILGRAICCKEGDRSINVKTASVFPSKPGNPWKNVIPPKNTADLIVLGGRKISTATPWNPFSPRIPVRTRFETTTTTMTPPEEYPIIPTLITYTYSPYIVTEPYIPRSSYAPNVFTLASPRPNEWSRLWSTTASPLHVVNVTVIQTGSRSTLREDQVESIGAIVLIRDGDLNMLVDTGAASETEVLLKGLGEQSVALDDVNTVIVTHAHPGHVGNLNFFGQKPILFHSKEFIGHHVTNTELVERPYRKLTPNVEVWKTPGHTQHDLSVLVHNVPYYGTMAIVGDLIPAEIMLSDRKDPAVEEGVWDTSIKRQNANLIVCMADWIVPGHGAPFKVIGEYRQRAGCSPNIASTRRKKYKL